MLITNMNAPNTNPAGPRAAKTARAPNFCNRANRLPLAMIPIHDCMKAAKLHEAMPAVVKPMQCRIVEMAPTSVETNPKRNVNTVNVYSSEYSAIFN